MSRIFITGSSDGLGKATAVALHKAGHEVIIHVRDASRMGAVRSLTEQGVKVVAGDLSDTIQVIALADSVNALGQMDAIIHNAGVASGSDLFKINVLAPFMLSVLINKSPRMIFLSSSMHRDGKRKNANESWSEYEKKLSYSDSKMLLTTLSLTLANRWPGIIVSSVDPGWVPTKMGGSHATDDLDKGYETQAWLAVSDESRAKTSGHYWHHKQTQNPHDLCQNVAFQDELLQRLEEIAAAELEKQ